MAPPEILTHSAADGYAWHYRLYRPTTEHLADVVCLHGIQSHGGWYEFSCNRLADAGFRVSFLDRRGSGLNTAQRGDTPNFKRLLHDLAEYLTALPHGVDRLLGTRPIFLSGLSWGGKLAVGLQRCHPNLVDGLLLLCPGLFPQVQLPLGKRLAILLRRMRQPTKLFPIPLNDPTLFTTTPRWLEFLKSDPLALHDATARFLVESVRLDRYLRKAPRHVNVPVLLQLAANDRIIRNDRTQRYVQRFAATDKQIITYPGAHHTLEFEPDPTRFVDEQIRWLKRQTAAWHRRRSP